MTLNRYDYKTPDYIMHRVDLLFYKNWSDPFPVNFQGDEKISPERNLTTPEYINPPSSKGLMEKWTLNYYDGVNCSGIFYPPQLWLVNFDPSTEWFRLLMSSTYSYISIAILKKRVSFLNPVTNLAIKGYEGPKALIYKHHYSDYLFLEAFSDIAYIYDYKTYDFDFHFN